MRLGIDVDDTIDPWYIRAHESCVRAGLAKAGDLLPVSWRPWEEYECEVWEWKKALERGLFDGSLYNVMLDEHVVDDLVSLKAAGHSIHYITARGFLTYQADIMARTVRMIRMSGAPLDSITFTKDKTVVDCDVYVDDGPKNFDALWENEKTCYLVTQTWNAHLEVPDYFRVADFHDFTRRILAMEMP